MRYFVFAVRFLVLFLPWDAGEQKSHCDKTYVFCLSCPCATFVLQHRRFVPRECLAAKGLLGVYGRVRLVSKWCHRYMRRCAKLRSTLFSQRGSCSSSRKCPVILSICSQLQRFLPSKMFRTKGILLVTTFLCFSGVISATYPCSIYSNLSDTLQSPGYSMGNYPADQNCTYDVRVPAGKRIILAFKRFNILGSMPHCPQDSLEIIVG